MSGAALRSALLRDPVLARVRRRHRHGPLRQERELRAAASQYFNEFVRARIFAEMSSLVAALRHAGVEIWAVSSTNKWVISEGLREFSIPDERILAAEVRVENGIITSEIVDVTTDRGRSWWETYLGDLVTAVVDVPGRGLVAYVQDAVNNAHPERSFTWQYVSQDGGRHWRYSTAMIG